MQLAREYVYDEQRCVRALLLLLEAIAKRDNHAAELAATPERRRGKVEVIEHERSITA
jgi:hypothetical protein